MPSDTVGYPWEGMVQLGGNPAAGAIFLSLMVRESIAGRASGSAGANAAGAVARR
jgi:hypothetical protein